MKKFSVLVALFCMMIASTAFARTVNEERARIDEVHAQAMDRFYDKKPNLISEAQSAYGYATLSSSRVFFFGRGRGVAINNETGEKVYLKQNEIDILGLGLGLFGCIEYDLLLTFEDEDAWDRFMTGKTKSSFTTVAVASGNNKPSGSGSEKLTARGVKAYMLTKKGLEASISWGAIKIYAPKKLNGYR